MSTLAAFPRLAEEIQAFNARGQLGKDPVAQLFAERRKAHGLFTNLLTDKELELLKPYLFCYRDLPQRSSDAPIRVTNFIDGEWRLPAKGEMALLRNLADRRIPLMEVPASTDEDVDRAVGAADRTWKSLSWADDVFTYRKTVIKNFSRMMDYFSEDCMREIRQQIPKTRLEAQKDFFEAKRAADHLEGAAEAALQGELLPPMLPGHSYWRNPWVPAGVSVIISPMNFIWGIPGIHLVGAYLAGVPFIYKGHPFAAISNTSMIRMMLAAGADPAYVQKIEGFGKGIAEAGHRPPGDGGRGDRLVRDRREDPGGPRAQPAPLRGRRLQLVLRGRRVLARGLEEDRGPPGVLGLRLRGAQVHLAPRHRGLGQDPGHAARPHQRGDERLAGGGPARGHRRQGRQPPDGAQGADAGGHRRRGRRRPPGSPSSARAAARTASTASTPRR